VSPPRAGPPERALLVECLLAAGSARPALRTAIERVHAGRLVALARASAVAETVGQVLLSAGVLAALPSDARAALREALEGATAKNALLVAEGCALQRALASAGIPSLALKGTALVAAHYPSPGGRHVGDLDLLVAPERAGEALEALRALGCFPSPDDVGHDGRPLGPGHHPHHLPPLETPGGVSCELHFDLPGGRGATYAELHARSREFSWGGSHLRVPGVDDLLGIACVHVLGSHGDDPRFLPRHLADLAVLTAAGADFRAAGRLHPGGEVEASRALLDRARAGDARAAWPRAGLRAPVRRAQTLVQNALAARQERRLLRMLFPAHRFLTARYGVAPDARWWPLLYLWRPLRALLSTVTGR
jgi:hypothetical protein